MAIKIKKSSLIWKSLLISFVIIAFYIAYMVFLPRKIPAQEYQIVIDKNQSMSKLATQLHDANIIPNRRLFLLILRLMHEDKKVSAGLYILKDPISTWGLIARITSGRPDQISITLIDGWSLAQVRDYINKLDNIQHLSTNLSDDELRSMLKITWPSLEGAFYPSTYFVAPNQTDLEIYQNAYKLMQNKLNALYVQRSTSSYYTSPYQMLIMASLIEKETSNPNDMFLISTVFNNRLRAGMKLQDDPAVFYGLGNQKHITRKDFQIDTPYNTYIHFGLPPTPICTPSLNALLAASSPTNNPQLLYFVAIGNGKTKFSSSYNTHVSLVNRYVKPDKSSFKGIPRKLVKSMHLNNLGRHKLQ
jgi:UPF0755 protein